MKRQGLRGRQSNRSSCGLQQRGAVWWLRRCGPSPSYSPFHRIRWGYYALASVSAVRHHRLARPASLLGLELAGPSGWRLVLAPYNYGAREVVGGRAGQCRGGRVRCCRRGRSRRRGSGSGRGRICRDAGCDGGPRFHRGGAGFAVAAVTSPVRRTHAASSSPESSADFGFVKERT